MLKANKKFLGLVPAFCIGLLLSFSEGEISPRLQKKIDAALITTFEVKTPILKNIAVSAEIDKETPSPLGENKLFEVRNNTAIIGYLYLGEAPSMKQKFDYIVMFNPDFTIKKSKVLIYREEHGKQIGSQRWLKQFIGLSLNDRPIYGEDIDAISGATISASSMTKAVGNVLESIEILKQKTLR